MRSVSLVATITLLCGAAWTLPMLMRHRFRSPLRLHLFMSLSLLGLGNLIGQLLAPTTLDGVFFTGFTKIAYNVAILSGLCTMICFLDERPLRRWEFAGRWDVRFCLICLALMITMSALLPPHLRAHTFTRPYLNDWRVRTFYDVGGAFLIFGYAKCAVLALRHARRGRLVARLSLSSVSVGLLGLSLSCLFRIMWVHDLARRGYGRYITYETDFAFGQMATILVCAGLSLPFFASGAQFLRERTVHRAQFLDLEELWQRLVLLYPELILDQRREHRWLPPLDYTSAVYRRYVECRDGLIRLSPYLQHASQEAPPAAGAPVEPDLACLVDRALRLRGAADGGDTASSAPAVFVTPGTGRDADYESDLADLSALSRRLRDMRSGRGERVMRLADA
ncbi:MAB_1171c family putative transporter [Streptomyces sp. NPDC090023]|uniref:MAB_1171c family putative transporter n=1 Tax=unclassified Streptomyces TaxID=2593676 RepID=UPI003822F9AE